jgi:DNA-binding XRE family transcriptional regulator
MDYDAPSHETGEWPKKATPIESNPFWPGLTEDGATLTYQAGRCIFPQYWSHIAHAANSSARIRMVRMMKSFRTRTIGRVFIMVALLGSTLSAQAQDVHQPGNSTTANATSHIPVTMTAAGLMERGMTQRQQGQLREAIGTFTQAGKIAGATGATEWQQRAAGELGVTLLQARHLAEAEPPLLIAYRSSQGRERARYAVYLGNLNQELKRHTSAENYYTEALKLAGDDADTYWSVQLNRLRSLPEQDKAAHIQSLSAELNQAGASPGLARHHLNLGDQATQLGAPLRRIAYGHLDTARKLAERAQDPRLTVESLDALAQLYENQGRTADALALIAQGQALAERIPPAQNADLNIALEWRRGRLLKASGQNHAALAAYRRVVEQLDSVRQDIPVEYSDGRSSYRSLFEPIYTTYIDLLLSQLDRSAQEPATANLQQAVQALELIRQTELQDFLGDRCATETAQGSSSAANGTGAISRALPTGTAVLYPLILSDPALLGIGQAIRELRAEAGLSQEALAHEAGVDRSYMGGIERGEHNMTIINLLRISRCLQITVSELLHRAGV